MRRSPILVAGALLLAGALGGCGRTEESEVPMGPIALQPSPLVDAIPRDYGDLVAVTINPESPSWSGLWFEAPDRGITVVWVNTDQGRIHDRVMTLPRR